MDRGEDGRIIVSSNTSNGDIVTRRTFATEEEAQREVDRIQRQAELNTVDIGESFVEAKADAEVKGRTLDNLAVRFGKTPEEVSSIVEGYMKGDITTDEAKEIADAYASTMSEMEGVVASNRSVAIRKRIEEEYGVDVDEALRVYDRAARSEAQQAAIDAYWVLTAFDFRKRIKDKKNPATLPTAGQADASEGSRAVEPSASGGEGIPNVDGTQENDIKNTENGSVTSALEKVPVGADGKRNYTAVTPDVAYDALMEQTGGNEAVVLNSAARMAAAKKKAYEAAKRATEKLRRLTPQQKAVDVNASIEDLMQEETAAENERVQALQNAEAVEETARKEMEQWTAIAGEKARREAEEAARIKAEEEAKIAAQKAEEEAARQAELQWKNDKLRMDKRVRKAAEDYRDCPEAVEILHNTDPQTMDEVAAAILSGGNLLMNSTDSHRGMRAETGFGHGDAKRMIGLFRTRENGGKTIEELSEQGADICADYGVPYDQVELKQALLDVLGSCRTFSDIRNYTINRRVEQAQVAWQRMMDEKEEYELAYYEHAYHMTPSEYLSYEDYCREKYNITDEDFQEIHAKFASAYEERDDLERERQEQFYEPEALTDEERQAFDAERADKLNDKENDTKEPDSDNEGVRHGGSRLLSEEQTDLEGGNELSHEDRSEEDNNTGGGHDGDTRGLSAEATGGAATAGASDAGTVSVDESIKTAEADVDASPTDAQKQAGNYKMGHVKVAGYDVTIENAAGSTRSGVDANGQKWETTMHNTYGYIRGTEGVDGDHIDVFLSDKSVFVVDQYREDGSFDEHKVMFGFNSKEDAFDAYLSNYSEGWEKGRRLDVTEVSQDGFRKWIDSSHRKTKPFASYALVKRNVEDADQTRRNIGSLAKVRG
jgi:hypothetical protein